MISVSSPESSKGGGFRFRCSLERKLMPYRPPEFGDLKPSLGPPPSPPFVTGVSVSGEDPDYPSPRQVYVTFFVVYLTKI